jgi:hypothetical protein
MLRDASQRVRGLASGEPSLRCDAPQHEAAKDMTTLLSLC